MPTLLSVSRVVFELDDLYARHPLQRPDALERYPGAHQSDILSYVARKIGKLKPGEPIEDDIPERVLQGIMFEEMYFSIAIPAMEASGGVLQWQPGELVEDEIAVNCDGLGGGLVLADGTVIPDFIEETKFTEKKIPSPSDPKRIDSWSPTHLREIADHFLEDFLYVHQGRAYCKVYGPRVVRWTIWYYRGNWAGSGPVCMQYVVLFSDKEVEQTWGLLRKNKDAAMADIAARKAARA